MPIGSAKIGVLGAGLVPGGCQTFNASGTFTVPPGVSKVNITGKGSAGNPGNPGNSGGSGNPGKGGGGGGGGSKSSGSFPNPSAGSGGTGGVSLDGSLTFPVSLNSVLPGISGNGGKGIFRSACVPNLYNPGWNAPSPANQPGGTAASGGSGGSGSAGTAGQAGQAGQAGGSSTGLCKTFPGGAAGNAGNAGTAGNGGSGGNAGAGGNAGNPTNIPGWCGGPGIGNGGAGGNCGGSGGAGTQCLAPNNWKVGGTGGGGAGATNAGCNGGSWNQRPKRACGNVTRGNLGGTTSGFCMPVSPSGSATCPSNRFVDPAVNSNVTGGLGGPGFASAANVGGQGGHVFGMGGKFAPGCFTGSCIGNVTYHCQLNNAYTPTNPYVVPITPSNANGWRSGGGGGSGGSFASFWSSGGGGGGGRGNAGNAGASGGTGGTGGAANPTSFNCVPVTPGSPYPITVASPGGQVVISWNPQ